MMMKRFFPTLLALTLTVLASCSTVPGTGRKQVNFISLDQQMALGSEAYTETLASAKVVTSGPDAEMVERIGHRVAQAAIELYPDNASQFDWEFTLIDDPNMINAWAMPGGKCAVYTGLLPVTGDENSLAIVMGHEVAHAIAEHGGERMTHQLILSGVLLGASYKYKDKDTEERALILGAIGAGATVGVMLPFSRDHESEADHIGLMLAAHAGYDPRAAVPLWERMGASGQAPPEWLSTHPSSKTRIKRLNRLMPQALAIYQQAGGEL